jgi:hypothetical protein
MLQRAFVALEVALQVIDILLEGPYGTDHLAVDNDRQPPCISAKSRAVTAAPRP